MRIKSKRKADDTAWAVWLFLLVLMLAAIALFASLYTMPPPRPRLVIEERSQAVLPLGTEAHIVSYLA